MSPGLLGWARQGPRPPGGSPETLGIFVERMGWAECRFPESRGLGRALPPVLFCTDHLPRGASCRPSGDWDLRGQGLPAPSSRPQQGCPEAN